MPWTKEEQRAYHKVYREKHKEEKSAYNKVYHEKHKEERAAYNKAHYEKHKERIATRKKAYNQTPEGKKSNRIGGWKSAGIISDDYDSLYSRYLGCKNCEDCNVELTIDRYTTSTTRCLDHNHSIIDRENVRNVLCFACNIKRG